MEQRDASSLLDRKVQAPADRSLQTRDRIVDAVITVLSEVGMSGLTHRRVAQAAGLSLSATTYHYETKAAMLADASQKLLAGYLHAFKRIAEECRQGRGRDHSLDEFATRLVGNATGRYRRTSLAWCEIILDAARSPEGFQIARHWFAGVKEAWSDLAAALGAGTGDSEVQAAIDTVVGLLFIILPLGLDKAEVEAVRNGDDPVALWRLQPITPEHRGSGKRAFSPKAERTRARILDGTIRILNRSGPGAVTYRAVAEESGVALTAPAYYFGSIDELIHVAEAELFGAAKNRYRQMWSTVRSDESATVEHLADVTAAILIHEATQFGLESLAHYSVWLEAARSASLRPDVSASVLDQARAWQRRLERIGPNRLNDGLLFQALFVGKLVRLLASGIPEELVRSMRNEFRVSLEHRFDCAVR